MNLQQISYQSIIALFESTFSASDTATIKESQKTLWQLACNPEFPIILHQILCGQASKQIKNSVAVYLKKLSYRYLKQQSQQLINKTLEIYWNIMILDHSITIKFEIAAAIYNILKSKPVPYLIPMIQIINKELELITKEFNVVKLQAITMIAGKLLNIEVEHIQKIGIGILNIITQTYAVLVNSINQGLNGGNQSYKEIGRNLETVLQVNKLILKHIKKGNFLKHKQYIVVISKQSLANNLWLSLQLPLPLDYSQYLQHYNPPSTFIVYNQVKSSTIQIITRLLLKLNLLNAEFGSEINQITRKNPVYLKVIAEVELFKFIVPLISVSDINLLPKSIVDCIRKTLRLLTILITDPVFQSYFLNNKPIFIQQVILPLLKLTQKQFEDYVLDPQQFINYLFHSMPSLYKPNLNQQDQEQANMILTGYACQFLKSYCTFQHGTLIDLFTACSENLIKGDQQQKQLALIVLGSLMSEIVGRQDLMDVLNAFVSQNVLVYESTEQDKYTRALRMFLGYKYLVKFAVSYQQTAIQILKLALMILKGEVKKNSCLELMSIEIIRDLINYGQIMCMRFEEILLVLASLINKNSHDKIIELINNIISQYFKEAKFNNVQLVLTIIHQLIIRIQKQTLSEIPNIDVRNRALNIIKTISYLPKFGCLSETISSQLTVLYPFFEDLTKIDFEEDIIIISSFLIKHSQKVTKQQFQLFKYFKTILIKNHNTMAELFLPTCLILTYGQQWLINYPETVNLIFEMCQISMNAEISVRIGQPEHLQGIVTLQSALIGCQEYLTVQIINKLFILLFKKFFQKYKMDQLKENIINCLGLLLYKAIPLMNVQDSEKTLTLFLCNQPSSCKSIYTLKTYLIALCKILHLVHYELVKGRILTLLNALVDVYQMLEMTKDEIVDEDQELSEDQHQYTIFVENQLINKVTLTDELAVVKETIEFLVKNHKELLIQNLKKMNTDRSTFLKSLSSTVTVDNRARQIVKVNRNALQ